MHNWGTEKEKNIEKLIDQNFQNLIKNIPLYIQETQSNPKKNKYEVIHICLLGVQMIKSKDKLGNSKIKTTYYRGKIRKISVWLLSEAVVAPGNRNGILNLLKGNIFLLLLARQK